MSKKILITSLSLLLISGSFVFAEESSSSSATSSNTETTQIKNDIKVQKQKILEDAKKIKEAEKNKNVDIKKLINDKVEKKVESQKEKVLKNFDVAIRNLESLLARANSRIEKIELAGKSTDTLKSLAGIATEKIMTAKTEYTKLENSIPQMITVGERKTVIASIKSQSEKTKTAIKSAHEAIVNIINSMKKNIENSQSTSTNQ